MRAMRLRLAQSRCPGPSNRASRPCSSCVSQLDPLDRDVLKCVARICERRMRADPTAGARECRLHLCGVAWAVPDRPFQDVGSRHGLGRSADTPRQVPAPPLRLVEPRDALEPRGELKVWLTGRLRGKCGRCPSRGTLVRPQALDGRPHAERLLDRVALCGLRLGCRRDRRVRNGSSERPIEQAGDPFPQSAAQRHLDPTFD